MTDGAGRDRRGRWQAWLDSVALPTLGFPSAQLLESCTQIVPTNGMMVQMANVRDILIEQLAYVRACDPAGLESEIKSAGGDLEIDSKEGQTVAIRVELLLEMEGLIRPEDQKRENLTSISSLEALIERRRAEREKEGS